MSGRGLSARLAVTAAVCAIAATACTPIAPTTPGAGGVLPIGTTTTPKPTPKPTPTPTSAPGPAYPGTIEQFGSTGAAVTLIQQKLGVTPATGYFGSVTEAFVKTFQQVHGLVVDGQVGPLTWAMIFGSNTQAPIPVTPPNPTPTPTPTPTPAPSSTLIRVPGLGAKALALVATLAGKPYLWGAAGPNAFDCSGLTQYVYGKLGVVLQRSADQQSRTTLHIPYSQAQPGDLIFFYDTTGYVYHVGMYAGNGMMWDAPHSGAVVRYENVWYPNSVWVGVPGARLAS